MLQRHILIWLVVSSGLAFTWPILGISWDPFVGVSPYNSWLISTAMFAVGALLPLDEMNQLVKSGRSVVLGTFAQYFSMPLLAWIAILIFRPNSELATGILIVGCVPGAMASNVLTMTARGNVGYSVSLTTCSTLLSPLVVPQALAMFIDRDVKYDERAAVTLLIQQVALPVIAGHLVSRFWPFFRNISARFGPDLANLAILAVIASAVAVKRTELHDFPIHVVVPLVFINLLGYAAGYLFGKLGRLSEPMRRALTLEVGMQNAGAGTVLATQLFGAKSEAIVPCVLYTFGCMLTGTMLATVWNRIPVSGQNEKSE